MKIFWFLRLMFNFVRGAFLSGWATMRITLRPASSIQDGLTRMDYGELSPAAASVLAAMVTLTPGTTAVDIDLEQNELVLHLLDSPQRDATLHTIRRDFIVPLQKLLSG